MKRKLMTILLSVLLLGTGCGTSNTNNNKDIIVALTDDTGGDKMDATTYNGPRASHGVVYEPLVEYGENGKMEPGLATAWEVSEDGKIYVFHLRKNVTFSDGTPFNAQAVKFSLDRSLANEAHKLQELYKKCEQVEIVDEYTVKLHFNTVASQVLLELSQARPFRIMSPSAVSPQGDVAGTFVAPIGTGPWVLDTYIAGDKTIFTPNTTYWKEAVTTNRLVFKVIKDAQARTLALQNGEIDIAGGEISTIPLESYALFENEKYTIETHSSTMSYFMVFNQENEFLADIAVRQAINYGTNTAKVYNEDAPAVTGLYQPTVKFVQESNQPYYSYDTKKAQETLNNAGYILENGVYKKDGKVITINLVIQTEEFPEWKQMAEVFQSQMKAIGITVNIITQEKATYYDTLWKTRTFDAMIYRTYTDAQVPYRFMTSLFYATEDTRGVAFSDARVTALLDTIGNTANEEQQQVYYNELFKLLYDEAMTLPLYYKKETFIVANTIENFIFSPIEDAPVKWHLLSEK